MECIWNDGVMPDWPIPGSEVDRPQPVGLPFLELGGDPIEEIGEIVDEAMEQILG